MLKKNHNIFKRENKIILIKNENTKNKHPYKKILGLNLKKKKTRERKKNPETQRGFPGTFHNTGGTMKPCLTKIKR